MENNAFYGFACRLQVRHVHCAWRIDVLSDLDICGSAWISLDRPSGDQPGPAYKCHALVFGAFSLTHRL